MLKIKATKEQIAKAKKAKPSTAKLHPDEYVLGGDSRYINEKYKKIGSKSKPATTAKGKKPGTKKAESSSKKMSFFGL